MLTGYNTKINLQIEDPTNTQCHITTELGAVISSLPFKLKFQKGKEFTVKNLATGEIQELNEKIYSFGGGITKIISVSEMFKVILS